MELVIKYTLLFFRKISRYSPSESTKVYDKAMQRRHNSVFTPKATIAILKEDLDLSQQLNEIEKRVLVDRYLDVSLLSFYYIFLNTYSFCFFSTV